MSPGPHDHESDSRRRLTEALYARYVEQAETQDGVSFEDFVQAHPEQAADLRRLDAGMALVDSAIFSPGESLELGYEMLEELGHGGHGTVHRARDRALACDVAIKTFGEGPGTSANRRRFLEEARAMARVRHLNIVRIQTVDEVGKSIRLVMEYIDGKTLEGIVEDEGPLSAREAAQVGIELCAALSALHQVDIVHMDLKPGNVMRERGGRTVLLDFSLARSPSLDEQHLGGTPPFMAPEHFGRGKPGPLTDIYGLGATLYWLVSGRYPLEAGSVLELREAILEGRTTPLLDVKPGVPREFAEIVETAMKVAPEERYGSAGAFERALRGFLGGARGGPSQVTGTRRFALVTSLAAVVILAGAFWFRGAQEQGGPGGRQLQVSASLLVHPQGRDGEVVSGDSTVRVGDGLSLRVSGDEPFYLYLFDEDTEGRCFTLYPPEQNALVPPGATHSLPQGGHWVVDSEAGTENLLLIASRQPDALGEFLLQVVPRAKPGEPGLRLEDLEESSRGTLRSTSRGIGTKAIEPEAETPGGPEQSLLDHFEWYEQTSAGQAGIQLERWSLDHRDAP